MSIVRHSQDIIVASTSSSWTTNFQLDSSKGFDHVCVKAASIPKSWYLIQSGFNTFTLKEGTSSATVTVPAGNYSTITFAPVISTAINTVSPNHFTYATTFSSTTGKFTWTVTGNGDVQPQFVAGEHIYQQLGFAKNTTHTFSANTLTSATVVTFQLEPTLFLHSSLVGTGQNDNVLQHFFSSAQDFSNIRYEMGNIEISSKPLVQNIAASSFYLTDEYATPIDLNGQDIVLVLTFWKKDDVWDIIRRFVTVLGSRILEKII